MQITLNEGNKTIPSIGLMVTSARLHVVDLCMTGQLIKDVKLPTSFNFPPLRTAVNSGVVAALPSMGGRVGRLRIIEGLVGGPSLITGPLTQLRKHR